jgi:hypothetical protein
MFFFPVTSPVAFFLVIVAIIGHCRICSVPAFFVTMHTGLLSAVQTTLNFLFSVHVLAFRIQRRQQIPFLCFRLS